LSPIEVVFSPAAERDIKKLTRENQKVAMTALKKFSERSELIDLEKLQGHPDFYRFKAGRDLRVIYHYMTRDRVVILVIRDRKDAYRGLDNLHDKLEATLCRMEADAKAVLVASPPRFR